ncbi:MAG: hypothetical protein WBA17_14525 [Saprospiraceae bacterium]
MLRILFIISLLLLCLLPLIAQDSNLRFNLRSGLIEPIGGEKYEEDGPTIVAGVEYAHFLNKRLAVFSGLHYAYANFSTISSTHNYTLGHLPTHTITSYDIYDVRRIDIGIDAGLEISANRFAFRPYFRLNNNLWSQVNNRIVTEYQILSVNQPAEWTVTEEYRFRNRRTGRSSTEDISEDSYIVNYQSSWELAAGVDVLYFLTPRVGVGLSVCQTVGAPPLTIQRETCGFAGCNTRTTKANTNRYAAYLSIQYRL